MRKYQKTLGVFLTSLVLLTGFKKNAIQQDIASKKLIEINGQAGSFTELPKASIADVIAVKGEKGKSTIQVMICLSKPTSKTVTMNYSTKDGNAKAGVDYNTASGSISFEAGEIAKYVSISILGEVAADPDEDATIAFADIEFEVNLNNAIGAIIEKSKAIITLIKDLFRPQGSRSAYQVRFVYKGYTSLAGEDIADCPIRSNGQVVLTGLLYAYEKVDTTEDVDYRGTLQLEIDIDICSTKTEEEAGGGYPMCGLTVKGSGPVKTDLKIQAEARGGYIKTEDVSGKFIKSVAGTCDQRQISEELAIIPNGTIASVFNGLDLSMLTHRTLRTGQYQQRDGRNVIFLDVSKIH